MKATAERYDMLQENRRELLRRLVAYGWLDTTRSANELDDRHLRQAIKRYQRFMGLKDDGWAGPVTERTLTEDRFCGVKDTLAINGQICKWPSGSLTWTITGSLPGISASDQKAAYSEAWSYWEAVCNVTASYTPNAKTANALMGSGPIDRSGSTLAWSQLPCGVRTMASQLEQKYDTLEPWDIAEKPAAGKVDLVRVAAHELGHLLGLGHLAIGNLLAPTYSATVRKPQRDDIDEVVQRYGPAKRAEPKPVPGGSVVRFTFVGDINGRSHKLTCEPVF